MHFTNNMKREIWCEVVQHQFTWKKKKKCTSRKISMMDDEIRHPFPIPIAPWSNSISARWLLPPLRISSAWIVIESISFYGHNSPGSSWAGGQRHRPDQSLLTLSLSTQHLQHYTLIIWFEYDDHEHRGPSLSVARLKSRFWQKIPILLLRCTVL